MQTERSGIWCKVRNIEFKRLRNKCQIDLQPKSKDAREKLRKLLENDVDPEEEDQKTGDEDEELVDIEDQVRELVREENWKIFENSKD